MPESTECRAEDEERVNAHERANTEDQIGDQIKISAVEVVARPRTRRIRHAESIRMILIRLPFALVAGCWLLFCGLCSHESVGRKFPNAVLAVLSHLQK